MKALVKGSLESKDALSNSKAYTQSRQKQNLMLRKDKIVTDLLLGTATIIFSSKAM